MKLENQVCTLEQAKKLDEIGLEYDEPIFVHWLTTENEDYAWKCSVFGESGNALESYPAYSASELGEMLPFYLVDIGELTIKKNYRRDRLTGWHVRYEKTSNCKLELIPTICAETQAQACALMLIYLLESKLITPEQVSQSLNS